jgi:competence protein ComEA
MNKLLVVLFVAFCSFNVMAKPVNINSADAKTIGESLKGIGLKKAEAIVKYRTEKGPFKTVDELDNVSGIGKKTVDKIRSDVLLSDEAVATPEAAKKDAAVEAPKTDKKPDEKADKKAEEKTK